MVGHELYSAGMRIEIVLSAFCRSAERARQLVAARDQSVITRGLNARVQLAVV